MQHLDPDRLVLLALGEDQVDDLESAHLADCPGCRREIDELRHVAELSAETQEVRDLPPPPDRVWQRIAAEVSAGPGAAPAEVRPVPGPAAGVRPGTAAPPPVDLAERRRIRAERGRPAWVRPLLVGAAAAVFGIAGTVLTTDWLDQRNQVPAPQVAAWADLQPMPDGVTGVAGNARVLVQDGTQLHIHATGLPLSTGFHQVWLIDPATMEMISVGTLGRSSDVLLPLPETVDLRRFNVVDISDEPYDGDTTHSGNSLLRGTLAN